MDEENVSLLLASTYEVFPLGCRGRAWRAMDSRGKT
jgi:hypothetical protein